MKGEIVKGNFQRSDDYLVEESISTFERLVKNCPMPTQGELKKLLAIQGTILNQIGLDLLIEVKVSKKPEKTLKTALMALQASRNALRDASQIEVEKIK